MSGILVGLIGGAILMIVFLIIDVSSSKDAPTYTNGHEYERFVAWYLGKNGYKSIEITKKTGDFGADIICLDSTGKKRIAVQCKMYAKPVGYKAVEEALGAMHYYNCDEAMVVTNNDYTKQAETAARRTGVKLMSRVK